MPVQWLLDSEAYGVTVPTMVTYLPWHLICYNWSLVPLQFHVEFHATDQTLSELLADGVGITLNVENILHLR